MVLVWGLLLFSPCDVLSEMCKKYKEIKSYTCLIEERVVKGEKSEHLIYKCYYKKPGWIKLEIIGGDNKGAVVVYNPEENRVIAQKKGVLSFIRLKLPPDNKRVCSIRGGSIPELTLDSILERWKYYMDNYNIEVKEGDKKIVLVSRVGEPERFHNIDLDMMVLEKESYMPEEIKRFHGDTLVEHFKIKDVIINPEIAQEIFKL